MSDRSGQLASSVAQSFGRAEAPGGGNDGVMASEWALEAQQQFWPDRPSGAGLPCGCHRYLDELESLTTASRQGLVDALCGSCPVGAVS
jgi:hypothetical protein